MSLQADIKSKIKDAMMAKDSVRLNVLRGMTSAFTNELVAQGMKPQDELSDEDALKVIMRLGKQRKDSIEQFKAGGRTDLVEEETAQLAVIEEFMPQMMGMDEIVTIASEKKESMGITDASKKGMLMSEIMKELKGKADGADVKNAVDSLFA